MEDLSCGVADSGSTHKDFRYEDTPEANLAYGLTMVKKAQKLPDRTTIKNIRNRKRSKGDVFDRRLIDFLSRHTLRPETVKVMSGKRAIEMRFMRDILLIPGVIDAVEANPQLLDGIVVVVDCPDWSSLIFESSEDILEAESSIVALLNSVIDPTVPNALGVPVLNAYGFLVLAAVVEALWSGQSAESVHNRLQEWVGLLSTPGNNKKVVVLSEEAVLLASILPLNKQFPDAPVEWLVAYTG